MNKKIIYCGHCKKQIKEEHDSIVCDNFNDKPNILSLSLIYIPTMVQ